MVSGNRVEHHEKQGNTFIIQASYPKTLVQEYGGTVPAYVTAAAYDEVDQEYIYLVCENTVYEYAVGGASAPGWTYLFVKTFDFTVNAARNLFSVTGPQTTAPFMAQPPSHVTALYTYADYVYAWKGFSVYRFYPATGEWEDLGTVVTPCG